jgi:GntR family transcriptional repressor for pyruvate dehydrogenase complex
LTNDWLIRLNIPMKREKLTPVRLPGLVDTVEQKILDYIGQSELSTGDSLPTEMDFSRDFEVSRNIVREALSRLEGVGLIDRKKRRGITLCEPDLFSYLGKWVNVGLIDRKTVMSLYELRIILETGLADILVKRVTSEDLEQLHDVVLKEEEAGDDPVLLSQWDRDFHHLLYRIAGNPVLLQLALVLDSFFTSERYLQELQERIAPHFSHRKLYDILKRKEAAEFREAMSAHLQVYLISN